MNITLNNGVEMPMIGIGTFQLTPDEAENSVRTALQNGYRLIDTANAYVNEKAVGRGIRASGVNREEIFLETKLWPTLYHDEKAVDRTLERLGVDYVDLMLLHQPAGDYISGWKLLEKGYREGKIRSIGISNFGEKQIEEILSAHASDIASGVLADSVTVAPAEGFVKDWDINGEPASIGVRVV